MRGQAFIAKKAMAEVQTPMAISFCEELGRTPVVKKVDADSFDSHKERRLDHKKNTRRKLKAKEIGSETVQMPDEYLPPNKILFLQKSTRVCTKDQLMSLFSPYNPNLHEVRLIPNQKDIAFVEILGRGEVQVWQKDAFCTIFKLDGRIKIKITLSKEGRPLYDMLHFVSLPPLVRSLHL
ncbi:hypothetical protein BKA70DRAFT_1268811 [Coprinopsis sp. MPI-PUGE-AT-0042]|nr:hypothetical protein BKA70DRAFT_1268811 [Coprinopsis sp. MPI-PUGE-AT-0042]